MGADPFCTIVTKNQATTIDVAFNVAASDAQHNYGHARYTGTIAEKDSYEIRNDGNPVEFADVHKFAEIDGYDNDKWGPAYVVTVTKDGEAVGWCFYGWASS